MDFFRQQERARRSTWRLILLFTLALGVLIAGLYLLCGFLFSGFLDPDQGAWDPLLFAWVAGGTLTLVGGGSLHKIVELRAGGESVARSLGGVRVDPATKNEELRKLVNVVEEMSIASGLPVPGLWVMESEQGINAFAAGLHPGNAVIGVTRGCLRQLNRDELQGVIAHEFSHILNGDMRINLRLMGLLHGLLCLTIAGSLLLRTAGGHRYGRSRGRGAAPILGLGLALLVTGYLGTLLARLIKAAISRQREFLADASAVQFTRNSTGIAGALQRIAGFLPPRVPKLGKGSVIRSPRAEEASHLFFSNGLSRLSNLMATHPPILERIRRIQPGFQVLAKAPAAEKHTPQSAASEMATGFAPSATTTQELAASVATPEKVVAQVGNPDAESLTIGREILACMPEELHAAAHHAHAAPAVLLAMLMHRRPVARRAQIRRIQDRLDAKIIREAIQLASPIQTLRGGMRLPLLDLCMPTLRNMPSEDRQDLLACVDLLIDEDGEVGFFELCMRRILRRHLGVTGGRISRPEPSAQSKQDPSYQYAMILSCLAQVGHADTAAARLAFADGIQLLYPRQATPGLLPLKDCRARAFDAAVDALDRIPDLEKRRLLLACARAASSDGIIETGESDLIRALADSFGCPLPPFRMSTNLTNADQEKAEPLKTQ